MEMNSIKMSLNRLAPIAFIIISVAILGYYAVYLNRLYYSTYGPFYDSMSYMNQLAMTMGVASKDGFIEAVRLSSNGSTVFFPWLEGSILGLFVSPAREYSVLIQLPLVLMQSISGYIFFRRVPCYSKTVSVLFSIVLISFAAMFFYNGGLSDLRMDLSQELAFGSALAFFSVAHKCRQTKYWILFGVMLGISFLVRATTPVYASLVFGTCALVDVFVSRGDMKIWLKPYLLGGGVATLMSLWFFISNFNELHYYYFVWNYDANASLPLSQSIDHLNILFTKHLGAPIYFFLAVVFLAECYNYILHRKVRDLSLNWVMLLGASIPVGFLVFLGAALNPFVSMISVSGLIMFGLAPFKSNVLFTQSDEKIILYVCGAFIAIALTASCGIENHRKIASPWTPSATGIQAVTNTINKDMSIQRKKLGVFEVTFVGSLDSTAIMNSFIYDLKFTLGANERAEKNGLIVKALHPGLANPVEWAAIPGRHPKDKLQTLVDESVATADYLIMPDNNTTFVTHHPISPYAYEFRDLLIKSKFFTRISGPIKISSLESVSIYRNNSR